MERRKENEFQGMKRCCTRSPLPAVPGHLRQPGVSTPPDYWMVRRRKRGRRRRRRRRAEEEWRRVKS